MRKILARGFRFVRRRGFRGILEVLHIVEPKNDFLEDYNFIVTNEAIDLVQDDRRSDETLRINWFIGDPPLVSWNFNLLFNIIARLEDKGIHNCICLSSSYVYRNNNAKLRELLDTWYPIIGSKVELCTDCETMRAADINIATSWQTAYYVARIADCSDKYFFVQSYEPCWYAAGSFSSFAHNSYDLGLLGISVGTWLSSKIGENHNMEFNEISLAYDRDLFSPGLKRDSTYRVLFYASSGTPTQNYVMGKLALEALSELGVNMEVVYFGDEPRFDRPSIDASYDLGLLKNRDLAEAFNQCDVALLLSEDNPTEMPLEVMASGVVPILIDSPSNRWFFEEESVIFSKPDVDELACMLNKLYREPAFLGMKKRNALQFAQRFSWDSEINKLMQMFSKEC